MLREIRSLVANHREGEDSRGWAVVEAAQLIAVPAGLEPGECLGPYRIVSFIAAGGMGAVYRAFDPRMGREVAIKGASERFSGRFSREVQAVAALNHPNICHVYDVGPNFLVMELIEGESPKGPLPLETALQYARPIAAALEAAHEKGIVHRDLKPGNIKVKSDSTVKVLDFGLAAAAGEETYPQAGTVLGTPAYMSPEQARGKAVDKRSDIWAFGVVLYEMVTGRRPFEGDFVSETLAAVIDKEPDWKNVPVRLRMPLRLCLEKDRNRRLRDIGDLWLLPDAEPGGSSETCEAGLVGRRGVVSSRRDRRGCAAAHRQTSRHRELPIRPGRNLAGGTGIRTRAAVWAPDGGAFAYHAVVEGHAQIFVRYLNSSFAAQTTYESGLLYAIGWSADSRRIFVIGKVGRVNPTLALLSVSVTGGAPEFVMALDNVVLADVSQDGKVLAVMRKEEDGSYSVAVSSPVGAALKPYSPAPFKSAVYFNHPDLRISPDHSRILYFLDTAGKSQVWSLPLPAGSGIPKRSLRTSAPGLHADFFVVSRWPAWCDCD